MPIWKVPQDHPQCNAFLGGLTELRKSLCSQPQCIIVKGHRCKLAKGRCLPSRVHRSPRCSFQLFLSVESCRWLLWFNVKCPPIGTHVWTFGSQLAALFREFVKPVGVRASLEEVGSLGQDLRFYCLVILLVPCLLPDLQQASATTEKATSLTFLSISPKTMRQINLFSLKLFLDRYSFGHHN